MKNDPKDPSASSGDDLFDLPRETAGAKDVRPAPARPHVDSIPSALPKRTPSTSPAGPPLSTVEPTVAGILEQIRPAVVRSAADLVVEPPVHVRTQRTRNLWLAFGAIAAANALVIAFLFPGGADPAEIARESRKTPAPAHGADAKHADATVPEIPVAKPFASPEPAPVDAHRAPAGEHASASIPHAAPIPSRTADPIPSNDRSALEVARASLAEARADFEAGRRGAARARLGRIGLAIDAIDPSERETLRADVALLLAQAIQADADETRGTR